MTWNQTCKFRPWLALVLLLVGLSGCVTVTDSRFAREADREQAVSEYVQLGTAYVGQGNLDRARKHLDRALEISPESAPAHSAMGLVYQRQGEENLAESSFRKALSHDPDYTRGRIYYGGFLFAQQRYREARDQFARAARDTGYQDRASVFFNIGLTEERLDNNAAAIEAYRRSVELSRGSSARGLLALSRTLLEGGDYDAAARYYSQLSRLMAQDKRLKHSPESLLTGIRIARHYGESDRESSMALLLKNEFPGSVEYQQYRVLISNGE